MTTSQREAQPAPDDPLGVLRGRLQRLHRLAGEPSTRDIARHTSRAISHTTVHSVLRCERVPKWGQLELVVEQLQGDLDEFRKLWVAVRDGMEHDSAALADSLETEVPEPARMETDGVPSATPARARRTPNAAFDPERPYEAVIVSCDIVGHSSETLHSNQRRRVAEINSIVAATIEQYGRQGVVWASGGDGGHVVFRRASTLGGSWQQAALELMERLQGWSFDGGVPLRVTGHAGKVTDMVGADGRIQIVGDGINVAGWLLTRGGPDGIVVTEAFRQRIERGGPVVGLDFHDRRVLRDKKRADQQLMLMSLGSRRSQWYQPVSEDREQLRKALARLDLARKEGTFRDGWEVLLFAKRVLQVNKNDSEARRALGTLNRIDLQCRTDEGQTGLNPFFEDLDATLLREVVESAELVQRGYNEVICRTDDAGDTMFVILQGRVGVYKRRQHSPSERSAQPDYSHQEGEVVGELAFALARNRTADLVALTDTVLLSFNHDAIMSQLGDDGAGKHAKDQVDRFITYRVLQHMSDQVPFLVGPRKDGPLTRGEEPSGELLKRMRYHCQLTSLSEREPVTLDGVASAGEAGAGPGLYVLVAGRLKSQYNPDVILSATDFPVLWIDLPGFETLPKRRFITMSDRVKVLRIDSSGVNLLNAEQWESLRRTLTGLSVTLYDYDIFLSYGLVNADLAEECVRILREDGLRVHQQPVHEFVDLAPEVIEVLTCSRLLALLVTPEVEHLAWWRSHTDRVANAHSSYFSTNRQVVPVLVGGVRTEPTAGVSPILLDGPAGPAMQRLQERLRS